MNKREQLAAMRIEDFKAHLRTIAGEDPKGDNHRRTASESAACAQSQEGNAGAKAKEALMKDVLARAFDDQQ